jgi:hypothetical protein
MLNPVNPLEFALNRLFRMLLTSFDRRSLNLPPSFSRRQSFEFLVPGLWYAVTTLLCKLEIFLSLAMEEPRAAPALMYAFARRLAFTKTGIFDPPYLGP